MERRLISIATVVFITAGLFALFVVSREKNDKNIQPTPITPTTTTINNNITNEKPPQEIVETTKPTITVNAHPDWEIFRSNKFSFALGYPKIMEVRQEGGSQVTFILLGPTQSTIGSELYDGFTLTIKEGVYNQENLSEFVNSERSYEASDPINESVSSVSPSTLGGKNGYIFETVGLGEYTHFYLETDSGHYLRLTYFIADPNELDHMGTLNYMISTLNY